MTKTSPYQVFTWTPKDAELLTNLMVATNRTSDSTLPKSNPQNLIRKVMATAGVIRPKAAKMMLGDVSRWQPGSPIKVSLYREDLALAKQAAEGQGIRLQALVEALMIDHFDLNPPAIQTTSAA